MKSPALTLLEKKYLNPDADLSTEELHQAKLALGYEDIARCCEYPETEDQLTAWKLPQLIRGVMDGDHWLVQVVRSATRARNVRIDGFISSLTSIKNESGMSVSLIGAAMILDGVFELPEGWQPMNDILKADHDVVTAQHLALIQGKFVPEILPNGSDLCQWMLLRQTNELPESSRPGAAIRWALGKTKDLDFIRAVLKRAPSDKPHLPRVDGLESRLRSIINSRQQEVA